MSKPWWGTSWCTSAWAILGYDYAYVPLCSNVLKVQPWSLAAYGFALLIIGAWLLIMQAALGLQPGKRT